MSSVVQDGKKLIFSWNGAIELYDLRADPARAGRPVRPRGPVRGRLGAVGGAAAHGGAPERGRAGAHRQLARPLIREVTPRRAAARRRRCGPRVDPGACTGGGVPGARIGRAARRAAGAGGATARTPRRRPAPAARPAVRAPSAASACRTWTRTGWPMIPNKAAARCRASALGAAGAPPHGAAASMRRSAAIAAPHLAPPAGPLELQRGVVDAVGVLEQGLRPGEDRPSPHPPRRPRGGR